MIDVSGMLQRFSASLRWVSELRLFTSWKARFNFQLPGYPGYEGPRVGLKTSGNYGDLPIPLPRYYQLTKGYFDAWFVGTKSIQVFLVACACFGPLLFLPFWSNHKRALRDGAEKYGPTRYGQGKKDIL